MKNKFRGPGHNICVAMNFDQNASVLVNQGVQLAKKTGMGLHVVHCITPLVNGPWGYYLPNEMVVPELAHQAEENAKVAANKKLSEILANIPEAISVSYASVVADPVTGLLDEAKKLGSSMILTATSSFPSDKLFKGASTGIGLVMHSSIPVMVVKESHFDSFKSDRTSVIVADDLNESSKAALKGTMELAEVFGNFDVKHLHVHGGLFDNISDSVSEFMAESWKALNPSNKSPKEVMLEEYELRKEELIKRGAPLNKVLNEHKGTYDSKVSSGEIVEEIKLNADKLEADLIVFGRHEFIHKSPFSFGRVPFGSMLMQDRPIIVFPKD